MSAVSIVRATQSKFVVIEMGVFARQGKLGRACRIKLFFTNREAAQRKLSA